MGGKMRHWRAPGVESAAADTFAAMERKERARRLERCGIRLSPAWAEGPRAGKRRSGETFVQGGGHALRPDGQGSDSVSRTRSGAGGGQGWRADIVYEASMYRLVPLEVRRLFIRAHTGQPSSVRIDPAAPLARRAGRLAAKALYALGLDCGIVAFETDDKARLLLRDAALPDDDGSPAFPSDDSQLAEKAPILLGADPEFVLLSPSGKVVSAAKYLQGGFGAGCDAVIAGGRVVYPLAELRPEPSASPEGLTANMRALLLRAAERIGDARLRWAAGGMPAAGLALGGHIHLSGVPLTPRLLRQLDSYAALPLAAVETAGERARRPKYGALGDFRLQPHGGFEYRTLPSWLVSPAAARAVLALALLCARESEALDYIPAAEERFAQAYYDGDKETLRSCLPGLLECMSQTRAFAELKTMIEPLFTAALAGKSWDTAADIRVKWRIPPYGSAESSRRL